MADEVAPTEAEREIMWERWREEQERQWGEDVFIRMNSVEEVEDEEAELVEDDVFPPHNGRYVGGYRI